MTTGISGVETLDDLIARCKAASSMPQYVEACRGSVESFLQSSATAGQDPNDQKAWQKTKEGKRPLKTAPSRIRVRSAGSTVIASIRGHYVFHQFGAGHNPVRRTIPQGSMPPRLGNAIRLGMVAPFEAATKAGKRGYRASGIRRSP